MKRAPLLFSLTAVVALTMGAVVIWNMAAPKQFSRSWCDKNYSQFVFLTAASTTPVAQISSATRAIGILGDRTQTPLVNGRNTFGFTLKPGIRLEQAKAVFAENGIGFYEGADFHPCFSFYAGQ